MSKPYHPKLPSLGHDLSGHFPKKNSYISAHTNTGAGTDTAFKAFATNIITDNITLPNGNTINRLAENAALARHYVDENEK